MVSTDMKKWLQSQNSGTADLSAAGRLNRSRFSYRCFGRGCIPGSFRFSRHSGESRSPRPDLSKRVFCRPELWTPDRVRGDAYREPVTVLEFRIASVTFRNRGFIRGRKAESFQCSCHVLPGDESPVPSVFPSLRRKPESTALSAQKSFSSIQTDVGVRRRFRTT